MAQYTTFKCDKCGREWDSKNKEIQPVSIGIMVDFGNPSGSPRNNYLPKEMQAMWCRPCVMKTGIYQPFTEDEKKIAPPKISFDDKIVMLLEELGFQRAE